MIKIVHDGGIDIASAKSSRAVKWRNKEWQWSDFVNKISETHRTYETHGEYLAMKAERQAEVKNVGGFVGGHLSGGFRRAGSVLHRQLVTLDLDFAQPGFWDDMTLSFTNAAAMYSTHKHSAEKPRLRLIVPLSRPVFADEYEAVARRIAGDLNIEFFDPTTFQPERLMYWPSTPKDGDYEFEFQDGEWLDPDTILSKYVDWKDSSAWPVSVKVDKIIHRNIKKQGDPLEKPGVVGAFCRTYTISDVLDNLLTDFYDACDGHSEGRYSYKEGSTAAGLVTYEDKFAFSHHGTDPTSGKLCNAFDLVRIHKFGLQDEEAREGTPINKMPSYQAMVDFAVKDPEVKKLLGLERLHEAQSDFGDFEVEVDEDEDEDDGDWLKLMDVDRKGTPQSTSNNLVLILENDRIFKNNIAFDEFEQRAVAKKNLPWREVTTQSRFLIDRDDSNIRHYIEGVYKVGTTKLETAMDVVYERTKFHPVKEYLKSVKWDGEKRVDTLFMDYMGAEDSAYVRAVTRKTLCAAVTRIFNPGCKFDYMLTFVGKQGLGKSSLIGKLGKDWFSDSFSTVQGKEAFEQLQGAWIVEMAELSGLKKADVEAVKHFLAKREDKYRVAYGRRVENFPRQNVFFGSTNRLDFLKDPSGNRRFWPVECIQERATKSVFTDLSEEDIDQIWAEAVHLVKKGEKLYLSGEIEEMAREVQSAHSEIDERTGMIAAYLDVLLPEDWSGRSMFERRAYLDEDLVEEGTEVRMRVCAVEIGCEVLKMQHKDMGTHNTRFIHDIMRTMPGWAEFKSRTSFGVYGNQKGYYRVDKAAAWKVKATLEDHNKN